MRPAVSEGIEQLAMRACALSDAMNRRAGRRGRTSLWRHPSQPRIEVPYQVAAAIAVMEMGISEYAVIARAVGLTVKEVERVDTAEDLSIRQLAVAGIPLGESFKLDYYVRCPRCRAEVGLAPCIACRRR